MRLSPDFVRRALSGHASVGLLASVLLYLICLSGTLLVLHAEWERWEQPHVPEMASASPAAVQRAVEQVIASERGKPPTTHLYVQLPTPASPRLVLNTDTRGVFADATGAIAAEEAHGWSGFLVDLHYYLHLPATLGLAVVGMLGVMMAVLIVGGVLAHPRIFRDAFRLRARAGGQVALADWHNRLGVWTLPFGLAVAVTGALIGLASLLAWAMAATWYGGDVQQVFAPLFGDEPTLRAAAAVPDVERALVDVRARHPGTTPTFIILHDPGSPKQHVQVMGEHPRRLIFGEYYSYDAAGRYLGASHLSDGALGQQAAASTYRLHFGNFAGLPVKIAYIIFGLATVVVTATGTSIWLAKRRAKGRPSPRLEAMWQATIWGTPALFAAIALIRLIAGGEVPLGVAFWLGFPALLAASGVSADAATVSRVLRTAGGAAMLAVAATHLGVSAASIATWPIDLALAIGGLIVFPYRVAGMRTGARPIPA